MKIILLGDLHSGARNDSQIVANNQFAFFDDVLFPYMDKHKIKHIIQMGDIFDRRKYTNHAMLHQWRYRVFNKIEEKYELHLVIGNHDLAYRASMEVNSPTLFLDDYKNIHIYSKPNVLTIDNIDFLMMPWICAENKDECMRWVKESKAHYCCGHFEFAKFEMQKGQVMADGMDKKPFKKFDKVFSGHYHTSSNDGTIYYLGTPYELTWVDHGDTKGFWVFDTKTGDIEFVPNPKTLYNKIYYNDKGQGKDYFRGWDVPSCKDTYVKIVVVNKTDPYQFEQLIEKFYQVGIADLKIIEDLQSDIDEIEIEDDVEVEDTPTLIDSFCEKIDTDLEKEKFKHMVKSLYVEALSIIE